MIQNYKNILADKYMRDTNYIIIKDTDDIKDLEDQWNRYQSNMTIRQQRLSDDKSIELWNMTNQDHYLFLLDKLKVSTDSIDTIDYSDSEIDTMFNDDIKFVNENDINIKNDSDLDLDEYSNKIKRAESLSRDTNINMVIIYHGNSVEDKLDDLDNEYHMYLSQSVDLQRKADDMCIEIFGMNNTNRYYMLKDELTQELSEDKKHYRLRVADIKAETLDSDLNSLSNMMNNINVDMTTVNESFVEPKGFVQKCYLNKLIKESKEMKGVRNLKRLHDTPYFTPLELIDMGVHGVNNFYSKQCDNDGLTKNISVTTWFDSYYDKYMNHVYEDYTKEWIEKLEELYSDFDDIKMSKDEDRILARKQSILDLGWNPEIPFTIENRNKATERVNNIYMRECVDDEYISLDSINEDGLYYDDSEYQPVFLILTKGHTPILSNGIRVVTKSDYTHASIGFDPFLKDIYTFNISKHFNGLARETIDTFKNNIISVFMFFTSKVSIDNMRKNLHDFATHKNNYDVSILFFKLVGIDKKIGGNKYQQVCSTFVDTILKSGGITLADKNIELPSPGDLYKGILKLKNKPNKVYEVYNGLASKYNGKKIDTKLKSIKNKPLKRINETMNNTKHFYFYHLLNKDVKLTEKGLISLDYMYNNDMIDLYNKNSSKYRDRLTKGWEIYPDKDPSKLSSEEVYNGINKFRNTLDGNNQIYFFRYPPNNNLGKNMKQILKYKNIIRIDLDDEETRSYIKNIDWGYDMSFTGNKKMNEKYYRDISEEEYFSKYDDDKIPLFSTLNHISITPKYGYIPLKVLDVMKTSSLNESYVNEVKRFPVEFDDNGNLIIYKCKTGNIAYGDEIDDSANLLKTYKNTNNYEGIEYELAKLWYLMSCIEKEMNNKYTKKERLDILERNKNTANMIFKQYFEIVCKMDKGFNFSEYYNNTPFSDNAVKITNSTIKYSLDALKRIII